MSKQLPRKPHLDSLKKQARQLLKAHQSAQSDAATRIKTHFPRLSKASESAILEAEFSYQDAQYVLAHEYGFGDWSRLVMAVEILRQVEAAVQKDQPVHVLAPTHQDAEGMAERLAAHYGQDKVILMPQQILDRLDLDTWTARLAVAAIVVGTSSVLGFLPMYERLEEPAGSLALHRVLSQAHAIVNVSLQDQRSPLVISGPDQETGVVRDLASMTLTEFYSLYGSMTDYRF